jgi:hypothetical protein
MKALILVVSLSLGLVACAQTASGPSPIHGTAGQDNPGADEATATGSSTGSGTVAVPGGPVTCDRDSSRRC